MGKSRRSSKCKRLCQTPIYQPVTKNKNPEYKKISSFLCHFIKRNIFNWVILEQILKKGEREKEVFIFYINEKTQICKYDILTYFLKIRCHMMYLWQGMLDKFRVFVFFMRVFFFFLIFSLFLYSNFIFHALVREIKLLRNYRNYSVKLHSWMQSPYY